MKVKLVKENINERSVGLPDNQVILADEYNTLKKELYTKWKKYLTETFVGKNISGIFHKWSDIRRFNLEEYEFDVADVDTSNAYEFNFIASNKERYSPSHEEPIQIIS